MQWMDPKQSEALWEKRRRDEASVPMMDRAEYLRKYPRGGPERFSGTWMSDAHREFIAAIKRRNREAGRAGRYKLLWALIGLAALFGIVLLVAGLPQATMTVFVLVMGYCFVEMGMNLPHR